MMKKYPERGRIDVIVRKRPLNELEISRGDKDIVVCNNDCGIIREFKCKIDGTSFIEEHEFKVDRFYDEKADNELIYNEYVKPLVECAFLENMTCSCFTYGQTGSGKTYTMIGSRISDPKVMGSDLKVVAGIYEYAANDIYRIIKESELRNKINVVISFFEIYSGKLYDLLQNRKPLESLDNGRNEVIIRDLSSKTVKSKDELVDLMLSGLNLRKIGQNSQNDRSSRSHALLRIELKYKETNKLHGSLVFIDLAGSERGADSVGIYQTPDPSRATKQPFERSSTNKTLFGESIVSKASFEGTCINKSLLALKECIRAMESEKLHVPFRDSELTKVLRDIFLRESKNLMIANLSPSNRCFEQTINTMRYASKVKSFKVNTPSNTNSTIGGNTMTPNISTITTDSKSNACNSSTKGANVNNGTTSSTNNYYTNISNAISKLNSIQGSKSSSKYQEVVKSPLGSRFGREPKRNTPGSSNSPNDFCNSDRMDLDQDSLNSAETTTDPNNRSINTTSRVDNVSGTKDNGTTSGSVLDTIINSDVCMNNLTSRDSNCDDNYSMVDKLTRDLVDPIISDSNGYDCNNSGNGADYEFKSQLDTLLMQNVSKTKTDIKCILKHLELNETNSKLYNYLTSSLPNVLETDQLNTSDNVEGDIADTKSGTEGSTPAKGDNPHKNPARGGENTGTDNGMDKMERISELYHVYNRISALSRCVHSQDTIHNISSVLRIEFKLLLHLKQLIDTYFN